MTLLPTLKQRLANPDCLVDLAGCDLAGISDEGDSIRIGAMTRHVDVADSPVVQKAIPAVAHLAGHIGDRQVRNRGTIGGSVPIMTVSLLPFGSIGLRRHCPRKTGQSPPMNFSPACLTLALMKNEIITAISLPNRIRPDMSNSRTQHHAMLWSGCLSPNAPMVCGLL